MNNALAKTIILSYFSSLFLIFKMVKPCAHSIMFEEMTPLNRSSVRCFKCTHISQSVSRAAPDGRLGLSTYALAVTVLTVVLPRLQLPNTTHKENKG